MSNPGAGMPCPVCKVPLVMSERQGVEIDYCPQCRGVWLDRGELDKIIERSTRGDAPRATAPSPQPAQPQPGFAQPMPGYDQPHGSGHASYGQGGYPQGGYPQGGYPQGGHGSYGGHGKQKRRKSFLEELFD